MKIELPMIEPKMETLLSTTVQPGQKESGAAKDFEALLIAQLLRSAHDEGSGWLGTGDDHAGATASSLGEEQLAKAMADAGGLGLSKLIAKSLTHA
jgi:hypothetical protein